MMQGSLAFVLPPESHLISGGNIYNQHLLAALEAAPGEKPSIRVLSTADWARDVADGRAGVYLVDSLCLAELHACLPHRKPGQRFLLIAHHLPSLEPGLDPGDPMRAIEDQVLNQVDGCLATSPYTRDLLIERGLDAARIATVPPALPARDIPPLVYPAAGPAAGPAASPDAGPGELRALMVGNLIPRKGVLALLEALEARLAPQVAIETELAPGAGAAGGFRLDIVGRLDLEPGYAAACAQLVERSAVLRHRVHLCGAVPYEDMDACYRRASVFVSASRMETYGMALQEARRYGLPILAHAGGNAHNHFEHGKNGYLYDSMAALADGMVALMRDPARARALFEQAQRMRAGGSYTWPAAAASLLRQIARMIR